MAIETPVPRRRYAARLPREERGEQILDAALRVIVREGWAGATMERIAAEADIAKSVPYALFESRAGLLDTLLRREQERAFAVVAAAVPRAPVDGDPLAAIHTALMTFLEGVAARPDTWRLVLIPSDGTPRAVRRAIEDGRERWRAELERVAAELLRRLGLGELDAELVTHLARGHAEYLARLILEQPERFPPERIAAFVRDAAAAVLR